MTDLFARRARATAQPYSDATDALPLIDFTRIASAIRRRWMPMLTAAMAALLLVAIGYALSTPTYVARGQIGLERSVEEFVPDAEGRRGPQADSSTVDTEVQALRAPEIVRAVINDLGARRIVDPYLKKGDPQLDADTVVSRAFSILNRDLVIRREGTSFAISVAFQGRNPALTTDVVNGVMDAYVGGQLVGKSEQKSRETELLRDRIEALRAEVLAAESDVARYRAATNLVDIKDDSTSAQQALSMLGASLADAQAEQAAAEARAAAASQGSAVQGQASPLLRELRSRQGVLQAERADLAGRYGELHPSLANVDRQLADLDQQIGRELSREQSAAQAEAQVARQRTDSIRRSISKEQSELLAGNNASVRLAELERTAEAARALYQSFLSRYRKNVAEEGTEQSNAYIIARAVTPGAPISPSPALFSAIGLLAALLAAAAVGTVFELREGGFRSRREVEKLLGFPVLSTIADLATVPDKPSSASNLQDILEYLLANEGSVFNESFRSLRTALHIGRSEQVVRSLALCSPLAGEGKTTTSMCLAWSMAMAKRKVVVIDCDHRRATLSRSMLQDMDVGLVEVLKGEADWRSALIGGPIAGSFILPQKAPGRDDLDLMISQRLAELIAELSEEFDLVILDTPPVLPVAETRAMAAMTDAALLVVKWRKTKRETALQALEELRRGEANIAGVVMTQIDVRRQVDAYENGVYYYGMDDGAAATA
ncbi:MAG: polysaccharide biosynthesis tyrosine autokinase [Pacificimonas sp.]